MKLYNMKLWYLPSPLTQLKHGQPSCHLFSPIIAKEGNQEFLRPCHPSYPMRAELIMEGWYLDTLLSNYSMTNHGRVLPWHSFYPLRAWPIIEELAVFSAQQHHGQLGTDGTLPSFPTTECFFLSSDSMINHGGVAS